MVSISAVHEADREAYSRHPDPERIAWLRTWGTTTMATVRKVQRWKHGLARDHLTPADFVALTDEDILRIPGIGVGGLKEIRSAQGQPP